MELSSAGLKLIQSHEGLRLEAYRDAVGIPTIGYGHTKTAEMGQEITEAQALELLQSDVESFEDAVRDAVNVTITQNMFDALVSFAFNVGIGAFRDSTLLKKLNDHDYNGAADELLRWTKAGGKELAGLVKRREDERDLFLTSSDWFDAVDKRGR
ncbi:lysozyme [Aidingimonas halophila]|uniref:Lysozyme n=1 Tax=Aidingimonas halophila TaxID=574349 RepID=A0A1H2RFF4_9GAMM|nr:lysozyme [Aidingimonas halophila]GHC19353.1 lysozyme [Aidingimonas halophila]SDW17958.1 lysozyme [Aidingimonas halophila]